MVLEQKEDVRIIERGNLREEKEEWRWNKEGRERDALNAWLT